MDPMIPTVVSGLFKSLLTRGVFAQVGGALEARRARKVDRAFQLLVDSLVELDGLPAAEQADRLERMLIAGEPGVGDPHQALYEAFRSYAFTRTEAAWPYIARLAAPYVANTRPVDDCFRRTAWLLERCDDKDIAILRAAFRACEELIAYVNSPEVLSRKIIRSEVQFSFNGSGLLVNTSPSTDEGARELEIAPSFALPPGETAKAQGDAVILLGESRLGWYRSGVVSFGLKDGVPEAGGTLDRLIKLFAVDAAPNPPHSPITARPRD